MNVISPDPKGEAVRTKTRRRVAVLVAAFAATCSWAFVSMAVPAVAGGGPPNCDGLFIDDAGRLNEDQKVYLEKWSDVFAGYGLEVHIITTPSFYPSLPEDKRDEAQAYMDALQGYILDVKDYCPDWSQPNEPVIRDDLMVIALSPADGLALINQGDKVPIMSEAQLHQVLGDDLTPVFDRDGDAKAAFDTALRDMSEYVSPWWIVTSGKVMMFSAIAGVLIVLIVILRRTSKRRKYPRS